MIQPDTALHSAGFLDSLALGAGVEMDLRQPRYEPLEELVGYCRRVASAVPLPLRGEGPEARL